MNDAASDTESTALTYEEAIQVLRLSPDGLRRLADLDEAIAELRSARRSLLADRLESIQDAFDASRRGRATKEHGKADPTEALPQENEAGSPSQHPNRTANTAVKTSLTNPGANGSVADPSISPRDRRHASEPLSLESDLKRLRAEFAELRREVAGLRHSGRNGSDADLQQVQRRLSYLEAEIESREI